eukprot:CAMPEP_0195121584 /NCGR_PEP_ID=MMETSP0448-20130528/124538_1 /TAXON_ID=66468 /ORGANISM="Heterocapsa triquestra, Strain CCMP 448" /LENGTH=62 /DNA_ID=CAMNT_0040159055 /DNA_START=83 /DNA_END=269 /DNA_ORIENTATION=-
MTAAASGSSISSHSAESAAASATSAVLLPLSFRFDRALAPLPRLPPAAGGATLPPTADVGGA